MNKIKLIYILAVVVLLLVAHAVWVTCKVSQGDCLVRYDTVYTVTRVDSLYWEHLGKCAFISKDVIEYDKHGYPKIKDYPFIGKK